MNQIMLLVSSVTSLVLVMVWPALFDEDPKEERRATPKEGVYWVRDCRTPRAERPRVEQPVEATVVFGVNYRGPVTGFEIVLQNWESGALIDETVLLNRAFGSFSFDTSNGQRKWTSGAPFQQSEETVALWVEKLPAQCGPWANGLFRIQIGVPSEPWAVMKTTSVAHVGAYGEAINVRRENGPFSRASDREVELWSLPMEISDANPFLLYSIQGSKDTINHETDPAGSGSIGAGKNLDFTVESRVLMRFQRSG